MPSYDYKCGKCEHTFSLLKKVDDRHVPCSEPCPSCGVVGDVQFVIGAPLFSYTTAKLPTNTRLKEKLQQIHENTHGSRIKETSTITKI